MEFPRLKLVCPRVFMVYVVYLTTLYFLLHVVEGGVEEDPLGEASEVAKLKKYLGRFGYVRDYSSGPKEMAYGLKQFQEFANLEVTGKLDDATIKQMYTPRCGLRDPIKKLNATRKRRYNIQGTTWKKNVLTWRYIKETKDLDRDTVRKAMKRAMKKWSDVTNIEFVESAEQLVDIEIKFVEYQHGDPFRFDGYGGTLAHAYYPHGNTGLAGDVHFDDAEKFTYGVNDPDGRDIMWVATHELGHSLGLDHTPVLGAIMYPYYQGYKESFDLEYDDLVGIQTLYGGKIVKPTSAVVTTARPTQPPTTRAPITTRKPTQPPTTSIPTRKPVTLSFRPQPCPKSPITAIWFLPTYNFFVLITDAQNLYFIKPNGDKRAGPIPAKYYFPRNRVKGRIDSVFTNDLVFDNLIEYTIVFAGTNYHLYYRFLFVSGPHSIHDGRGPLRLNLPRYVRKIDAAFTRHKNGRVYLFSGSRYWKYDIIGKRLDSGYPKLIANGWTGVNRNVNAAFRSKTDRRTLFFSAGQVYRMNDRAIHVEYGYPRNIGLDLFYCKNPRGNFASGGSKLKVQRMPDGDEP